MDLNMPDAGMKSRCQGYIDKFYGNALLRTIDDKEYQHLNTSQLAWDRESKLTYHWCKAYLRKPSGSGGSRKQQSKRKALKSKRKALKSRKVSKKH
jgi:transposase